jgi:hypothetical protein
MCTILRFLLVKIFFCLPILLPGVPVWLSESPVPPGDQSPGEKSKKVDPGDPAHIGPENGFHEAELKLHNDHGKGQCKFE